MNMKGTAQWAEKTEQGLPVLTPGLACNHL
jgi:hypothetical protein